ncbi:MAG: F0F1 ATP synthase subunit epsilon [Dehalococcoidia bacterium]|nr:F0F1 ATP synthase subunit epsilon [Dehalococcoidia bacterium]
MSKLKIEIITAERVVLQDEVDMVVAPGIDGQLGILPHHVPLLTSLQLGELRLKKGSEEISLAITGGFLEVQPDRVVVLADAAEREEEIDVARAEQAKKRAEERLSFRTGEMDLARADVSLARSLMRLKIAEKRRRKKG